MDIENDEKSDSQKFYYTSDELEFISTMGAFTLVEPKIPVARKRRQMLLMKYLTEIIPLRDRFGFWEDGDTRIDRDKVKAHVENLLKSIG